MIRQTGVKSPLFVEWAAKITLFLFHTKRKISHFALKFLEL
jgi:hypothetical protein